MSQMLVSAGIWIASTFVDDNLRLSLWAAAILVELAVAFVPKWQRLIASVPLHSGICRNDSGCS